MGLLTHLTQLPILLRCLRVSNRRVLQYYIRYWNDWFLEMNLTLLKSVHMNNELKQRNRRVLNT